MWHTQLFRWCGHARRFQLSQSKKKKSNIIQQQAFHVFWQHLSIFSLYVWSNLMHLTSRWFSGKGKRLHVINIDVTNLVSSIEQSCLICFSQFGNLLLESRLQNENGNMNEWLYFLIIAMRYHLLSIFIVWQWVFFNLKEKEAECDTHSGWSIIFMVSKCYLSYRRTENSEHSKQLGTKKRAG